MTDGVAQPSKPFVTRPLSSQHGVLPAPTPTSDTPAGAATGVSPRTQPRQKTKQAKRSAASRAGAASQPPKKQAPSPRNRPRPTAERAPDDDGLDQLSGVPVNSPPLITPPSSPAGRDGADAASARALADTTDTADSADTVVDRTTPLVRPPERPAADPTVPMPATPGSFGDGTIADEEIADDTSALLRQAVQPERPLRMVQVRARPRVRRVTRIVRHVDPWSVFKVALVFNAFLYGVCLTAGVLLWRVAFETGTVDNIENFFEDTGWETFELKGGQIYHAAWIAGLFVAAGLTGLAVLMATLFNLITDLVGGVRVSVLEEEVVARGERPLKRKDIRSIRRQERAATRTAARAASDATQAAAPSRNSSTSADSPPTTQAAADLAEPHVG